MLRSNLLNMSKQASVTTPAERLRAKIESRSARVGVIGLGYVGLPRALPFSAEIFPVTGFDVDVKKIATLSEGGSYFHRIPPADIQAAGARGFRATSDYAHIAEMDAGRHLRARPAHRESGARP